MTGRTLRLKLKPAGYFLKPLVKNRLVAEIDRGLGSLLKEKFT